MRIHSVILAAAGLILLLAPGAGVCMAEEQPWAFAVVTDPEPHMSPKDPNALAPFAADLRYLKETFIDKATADRPRPELIIVPGDIAPAELTDRTFARVLGPDIPWMPIPGNHDQSKGEARQLSNILAGRKKLGLVWGPAGPTGLQYHFTYKNVLFAGLNLYWNGKLTPGAEIGGNGLTEAGLGWVKDTLGGSTARYKIVYGHRPAWPFGDRHPKETLAGSPELRDRFWKVLAAGGCQLYLCGHTHDYSTYRWLGNEDRQRWQDYTSRVIPEAVGVWQVNACSVRGNGSAYDRVVMYMKVTEKVIEVETHVWPKGLGSKGQYKIPANTDSMLYQFKIYPDLRNNLPPPPHS